eukprot:TRINITY_DN3101_c0_g1_i1.p1 TRINITY_DN3101_c0_g1~~TRINITY_DN3101_c0_g1_i1.p1  ORF type:complete len:552 (-),score=116.85 TRINITY_DN3101_c0_g1_i1:1509-3164(-)
MALSAYQLTFWFVACVIGARLVDSSKGDMKALPIIYAQNWNEEVSGWDLPFPYLGTTVTAAKVMMNASHVKEYDGEGKRDDIVVDILGQGPVAWSFSRFNRGDLSPRIQPRRPFAQSNLGVPPPPAEVGQSGGFTTDSPKHFSAQAWIPSMRLGVLLATVAQNGQQWDDGSPRFYGTVACVAQSNGYGYSMESGQFGTGDDGIDVVVGKAGAQEEGNIDVAIAWFPYAQGWIGGYVDQPKRELFEAPQWQDMGTHSPSLPDDAGEILSWGRSGASLSLPGVRALSDGMLFCTSTDPSKENNNVNVVGIYTRRKGKGWRVQQREDNTDDVTKLVKPTQMMFAFVFIPWSAGGLIGGMVDGFSGKALKGRGPFRVKRLQVGQYEIHIGGPREAEWGDDKKSQEDGVLLLQVTGRDDDNHHFAKHSFLSYNYTEEGNLVVEARKLVTGGGGEEFPLVDSDFSFAWIDFKHPITPDPGSFTGYFVPGGGGGDDWAVFSVGFFFGVGFVVGIASLGSAVFVLLRRRNNASLFSSAPGEADLGSDLLLRSSDFQFAE